MTNETIRDRLPMTRHEVREVCTMIGEGALDAAEQFLVRCSPMPHRSTHAYAQNGRRLGWLLATMAREPVESMTLLPPEGVDVPGDLPYIAEGWILAERAIANGTHERMRVEPVAKATAFEATMSRVVSARDAFPERAFVYVSRSVEHGGRIVARLDLPAKRGAFEAVLAADTDTADGVRESLDATFGPGVEVVIEHDLWTEIGDGPLDVEWRTGGRP